MRFQKQISFIHQIKHFVSKVKRTKPKQRTSFLYLMGPSTSDVNLLTWIGQSGLIVNLFSPKHEPRAAQRFDFNADSSISPSRWYLSANLHSTILSLCAAYVIAYCAAEDGYAGCAPRAEKSTRSRSFHQRRSRLLGNLILRSRDFNARFTHITQNSAGRNFVFSLSRVIWWAALASESVLRVKSRSGT